MTSHEAVLTQVLMFDEGQPCLNCHSPKCRTLVKEMALGALWALGRLDGCSRFGSRCLGISCKGVL